MASNDLIAVTSMIGKGLYSGTLGTGSADLLAPAALHGQIVKTVNLCNTSAASVTVTLTYTKSGGSAKTLVSAYPIAAGDSIGLVELAGMCLGPGDKLSGLASAASAVDVTVTGTENS